MNIEINIIYITLAVILALIIWIIRLEVKLGKLLGNKSGTIDDAIDLIRKNTEILNNKAEQTREELQTINNKLRKTISGNETVRFNPFKGTGSGSNQSFATALVNAEGDGVIISSLYSRDHMSVFSKPIKNSASEYELSTEEKLALQKAKESIV